MDSYIIAKLGYNLLKGSSNDMRHIPRFHSQSELSQNASLHLDKEQSHHISKVLRMKVGDRIKVFNQSNGEWLAEIVCLDKDIVNVVCDSQLSCTPQNTGLQTSLIFSPIKPDRMDYLIEKSVELGVKRLIPLIMDYTNHKVINHDKQVKRIINAVQQCGRIDLPILEEVINLKHFLCKWDHNNKIIVALEGYKNSYFSDILKNYTYEKNIVFMVGPEGGFSDEEKNLLQNLNFVEPVSLGNNILRTETAAVAMLAAFQLVQI